MPVTTAVCTPVASRSVSPVLSTTASTASTAVTTARTRIARTSMGFSFGWGSAAADGAGDHAGDTTSRAAHGDSSESDTSQPVLDRFELVDPACQVGDLGVEPGLELENVEAGRDRKSTRLNSSHVKISYAVFRLEKKSNR